MNGPVNHPYQQPQMHRPTQKEMEGGNLVCVETCEGIFPEIDPFLYPPGTNLLPTVYTDVFDNRVVDGEQEPTPIPNTLPSTPRRPYNLHDCDPVVLLRTDGNTELKPDLEEWASPTDDLSTILNQLPEFLTGSTYREHWANYGDCKSPDNFGVPNADDQIDAAAVADLFRLGIKILQGDSLDGSPAPYSRRIYGRKDDNGNGKFPLLHYNGGEKKKAVEQVQLADGTTLWNVNVHQIWYDSHIESDTSFIDLTPIEESGAPPDTTVWTITYTIDVLTRGKDDFSPMVMYFDHPSNQPKPVGCDGKPVAEADDKGGGQRQYRLKKGQPPPLPGVAMDQTFFPITEKTRTIMRIKMAPATYYNLTYTWGWRQHPPRVQVIENASKRFPPSKDDSPTLYQHETAVYGEERDVQNIMDKISDWDPAKRMWLAFRAALEVVDTPSPNFMEGLKQVKEAWCSFQDWKDRNHLPRLPDGYGVDPDTDLTLLYVNNTIYGELSDGSWNDFPKWRTRGTQLKVTLINADYYERGYLNIDFGGARGWESQFKPTQKLGGSGPQFSFGRFYWSINLAQAVMLRPAEKKDGKTRPTKKRVYITYNFEPSRRLRFYQFDPLHHDVAIFSLH